MRDLSREESVPFLEVTAMTDSAREVMRPAFLEVTLSGDERRGYTALGLDGFEASGMGMDPLRRRRLDVLHPSPVGHRLIADTLAGVVAR